MSKFVTTIEDVPEEPEVVLTLKTQVEQAAGRQMLNLWEASHPDEPEVPPEVPPEEPPVKHESRHESKGESKGESKHESKKG